MDDCITTDAVIVTALYTTLIGWGVWVGLSQVWQGLRRPEALLNPLFRDRWAQGLFAFHLLVVSLDLFVCGPLALAAKSPLWYWGGRIALLSCSLPLAAFLNRNPQSFGKLIGRWVVFRNLFEVSLHVAAAAIVPTNWYYYYLLLWWLVAYRYIDVGPRRLLQTLYATPEKLAARPWAPVLNWAVITALYVLTFLAVWYEKVIYAVVPDPAQTEHVPAGWEVALVIAINVVVALVSWVLIKKYTDSRLRAAGVEP